MSPPIQLIDEDATTTTLRMPKGLASYLIHIQYQDDFDIDFRELSEPEVTPELAKKAEEARHIDVATLINI